MGGWEKFQKQQKRKLGEGQGENKVPKNKSEIRAEKGQRKKVNLGWNRDRKENPIRAPSIHVGALVGCWFTMAPSNARIGIRHYKILISKM